MTRENRLQYIYLVAHYRLTKQIKKQSNAFFEGLSEIIDPKWLRWASFAAFALGEEVLTVSVPTGRMFNQQELQILLGGVNAPIDLDDLRKYTQYGGLYDDHHPTIELFWRVCPPRFISYKMGSSWSYGNYYGRWSIRSTRTSAGNCSGSRPAVVGRHYCAYFQNEAYRSTDHDHLVGYRGFKELNPNFAIRDATDDETRLPTASTCVNLLKVRAS